MSRLYASLGLGYDAPNSVEDDEFADNSRQGRPVGHARLQPHANAAGSNPHLHRQQGSMSTNTLSAHLTDLDSVVPQGHGSDAA